ncbi:hypothetical protein [Pseudomonas vancouverensis]|uniref:Secretion system X translation initiation factor n=1 Tax=Pseudomonas vancouverensis TaxID=95300 RepID=A0A1H2MXT9_PSEVA|nr:hypothetical protein [Pseudomonas vancouverensis]KAB0495607.1 hypothetical protein F7R09_13740 [Pseudomonas vancouverensis]TDB65410.1 hypothetical protein EIY72_07800 [Pseudomonas vancouverensis]SDU97970.1 hypothetical protein SAMN05216558_1425 [Pseudomonas vancouverensis]
MNNKRVVGWLAFFGVAAALAWLPEYFQQADDGDAVVTTTATSAKDKKAAAQTTTAVAGATAAIKDLSPAGDLFAARSWKAAPALGTVVEQPVNVTPVVQAPTAPPLPFQFVGRLDDRSDLQVFLQNGEKIYVVRKGDVIDETWRIERISDVELSLVYLPLHLSQTLSVGSTQ